MQREWGEASIRKGVRQGCSLSPSLFSRAVLIYFFLNSFVPTGGICSCARKKESTLNFNQIGQYLPTKDGPWNLPWDLHRRNHTKTKNLHHFLNFYFSYSISVDKNLHGMLKISS